MTLTLITGPARSGKSEWGESLAMQSQKSVIYVATALLDDNDDEWRSRIEHHRQRRPNSWGTWEVPVDLAGAIAQAKAENCLLVDSLGTWLANGLEQTDTEWDVTEQALLRALERAQSEVILVAEETGWGVVPAYPLGRKFRDRLGRLTRKIGAIATSVYLVVGGYALDLKQLGIPLTQSHESLDGNL